MSLTISALVHLTPELTKEITQLAFAAAAVDEMAPLYITVAMRQMNT
ncbi:MAG: hypothetical protein JZU67_07705 [Burkholderiaceae bacterium]|nr:hypothetical protein [Burkholderiaceae bacterium]